MAVKLNRQQSVNTLSQLHSKSAAPGSDVRLVDHSAGEVSEVRVTIEDQPVAYRLPSPSRRLVTGTLAALAVAYALGADWRFAARTFTDDPPPLP